MTTSHSPLRVLKAQADGIAKTVKAIANGAPVMGRFAEKIVAARNRESFKFGVVMDDKVITVEMTWVKVHQSSEVAIAEMILREMRGARANA